jgi:Zn-dependent protease
VRPRTADQDQIAALPYRDTSWYAGAGVLANLISAGSCLTLWALITHRPWCTALAAAATVGIWLLRRPLTAWLFPLVGLPLLVILTYFLVQGIRVHQAQGIVGDVQILSYATSLTSTIALGIVINLALAALNLLPLGPFDGGRIATAAIHTRWGDRAAVHYQITTSIAAMIFLAAAYGSDIVWALSR